MKIAIVGTGIAGNTAAFHLNRNHDITVYEAAGYVGGHTNTVDVPTSRGTVAVDTGFIVYNDRTYPNFIRLLEEIGAASRPSDMSFAVHGGERSVEYNGSSLNGLFADRLNLLRPSFHRMLRDIVRFNREAPRLLEFHDISMTLGDYLRYHDYSREFVSQYLVPMGAAIWSAETAMLERMPARFFVRFFHNHGLLCLADRPTWRVVSGGSRSYVERLVAGHRDRIRLNCPVRSIDRLPDKVVVHAGNSKPEAYDAVFIASHSDQALAMLANPTAAEREILGSIRYQDNEAVLHRDRSLMPRRRRAWASWNYRLAPGRKAATLTYHMNRLQGLDCEEDFFVTLNDGERIDPRAVIGRYRYAHPVFDDTAVRAQARKQEIDGVRRTFYCGAYWRYGFHEDGVLSALSALERFDAMMSDAEFRFQRAG